MSNQSLPLAIRTSNFSKDIIEFCRNEKLTVINRPIIEQLIRSATSIGANYAEANNAASKADFRNKIFIAKKETAETKYWLNLISALTMDKETCAYLNEECHYLLMTFQRIINTLNQGKGLKVKAG